MIPDSFDANDADTGTFLPARACRPQGSPKYDQFGIYVWHPDSEPYLPEEPDDQDPQPDAQPRGFTTEEELPETSGPPEALSPNDFLQDLTKAMNGMDGTDESGDQDATMIPADDPPTLVAAPPVETASPTSLGDLCVNVLPTEDPWETTDPWTSLTAYEEADGRNAQVEATPPVSNTQQQPPQQQPQQHAEPWADPTQQLQPPPQFPQAPQAPPQQRSRSASGSGPLRPEAPIDNQFELRMDNRMENIFERLAGSIAKIRDEAHAANNELNAKIEGAATKQIERDEKLNETIKNGQNAVTKKITDIEQRLQRLERDPIERPTSQRSGGSADGSLSVAQPDPWASP